MSLHGSCPYHRGGSSTIRILFSAVECAPELRPWVLGLSVAELEGVIGHKTLELDIFTDAFEGVFPESEKSHEPERNADVVLAGLFVCELGHRYVAYGHAYRDRNDPFPV